MLKALVFLLSFGSILVLSQASRLVLPKPQADPSFKINTTQNGGSCSYTVSITTSCSSPRYTRDHIGIAFGDAYGYQVYVPRIDDPSSRTFESCSTDTFNIYGPCTYQVCYVYFYRSGYDGWKPSSVTISGYYTQPITFYFNTYIPNNVWYGYDYCYGARASST